MEKVTENIRYIGVDDKSIDLFESQYIVPNGISYNSYLIKDEKNVVMDTVDKRATDKWLENLEKELQGEKVDYLVILHLEPDHSSNIALLCEKYPEMKLIGNIKTFAFLPQFFNIPNLEERKIVVKENDSINIGKHTLRFFMAPMVHWPEVMVAYEETNKILFSADAFGKFGALDIKMICPLHGPILKENLSYYINKYDIWSKYEPEDDGVFIAYASIHGNTAKAAKKLAEILQEKGAKKVVVSDLSREDMAECIEDSFRYDKIIVAASSYNAGVFPPMEQFLRLIKEKNYQNRKIGIIENGTWAPSAAKTMLEIISNMKDIKIVEPKVTIKTTLKEDSIKQLENLAENILKV